MRPSQCWNTDWGQIPTTEESRPMSKITELASGQITAVHALTIELVEAVLTSMILSKLVQPPEILRRPYQSDTEFIPGWAS